MCSAVCTRSVGVARSFPSGPPIREPITQKLRRQRLLLYRPIPLPGAGATRLLAWSQVAPEAWQSTCFLGQLQPRLAEVSEFEKTIKNHTNSEVEVFIHSDPCLPQCCNYCLVKDCAVRKYVFEEKIIWTPEILGVNAKHFDHSNLI